MLCKIIAIGFVKSPKLIHTGDSSYVLRFTLLATNGRLSESKNVPITVSFQGNVAPMIYERMAKGGEVAYVDGRVIGCDMDSRGSIAVRVFADRVYVFDKSSTGAIKSTSPPVASVESETRDEDVPF